MAPSERLFVSVGRVQIHRYNEALSRLASAGFVHLEQDVDSERSETILMMKLAIGARPSSELRKDMLAVLDEVRVRDVSGNNWRYLVQDEMAGHTLQDIYKALPSPPHLGVESPPGLLSQLFTYQRHTLAKMLQREKGCEPLSDPWLVRLLAGDGTTLYVDPHTLSVKRRSDIIEVADIRGGILSEEMGVGKTIECIALFLLTRGSLPTVSNDEEGLASAVTSEVALKWPQKDCHGNDPAPESNGELESLPNYSETVEMMEKAMQQYVRMHKTPQRVNEVGAETSACRVDLPKLSEICTHGVRATGMPFSGEQFEDRPDVQFQLQLLQKRLLKATPFFHLWPPRPTRSYRVEIPRKPLRIYLSPATLVLVPGTLLLQWEEEFQKHMEPGSLRILSLPRASSPLPSALDLANRYDVILLSHARFGRENEEGVLDYKWPIVPRTCQCPFIGATRIRDCRCPPPPDLGPATGTSPLLQCKFKRIVVDEGHVAAGNSAMVRLAARIRAECRWIVSGTPTETLVGSSLFRQEANQQEGDDEREEKFVTSEMERPKRCDWSSLGISKSERRDLDRLDALVCSFLGWTLDGHNGRPLWSTHVSQPMLRSGWGASTRLHRILAHFMVRNRADDVERDYPLPALEEKIERLRFTGVERMTFNILQALILLNAVWSQREDDDYFFHAKNRKYLATIMENLSLSCFHFSGPDMAQQAWDALAHAKKMLNKTGRWKQADKVAAQLAIKHLKRATESKEWLYRSNDVTFETVNLPENVAKAWFRGDWVPKTQRPLMSAEELMSMQRAAATVVREAQQMPSEASIDASTEEKPADIPIISSIDDEELVEELITRGVRDRRDYWSRMERDVKKKSDASAKGTAMTTLSANEAKRVGVSATALGRKATRGSSSSRASNKKRTMERDLVTSMMENDSMRNLLPHSASLAKVQLTATSSTKLRRLLEFVEAVPHDEKALIFSNLDNVLYEVSTALEIARFPHFIYASGTNQVQRNEAVTAFTSKQLYARFMLMKINVGGRGLDLSCANHAIFLEPIIDRALRVQALKRTWRTGQTRPVKVLTLVMQGTFEEEILRLRPDEASSSTPSSSGATGNVAKMSDDPSMRAVVSDPKFVEPNDGEEDEEDIRDAERRLLEAEDELLGGRRRLRADALRQTLEEKAGAEAGPPTPLEKGRSLRKPIFLFSSRPVQTSDSTRSARSSPSSARRPVRAKKEVASPPAVKEVANRQDESSEGLERRCISIDASMLPPTPPITPDDVPRAPLHRRAISSTENSEVAADQNSDIDVMQQKARQSRLRGGILRHSSPTPQKRLTRSSYEEVTTMTDGLAPSKRQHSGIDQDQDEENKGATRKRKKVAFA